MTVEVTQAKMQAINTRFGCRFEIKIAMINIHKDVLSIKIKQNDNASA
jgi:hypothetical protein